MVAMVGSKLVTSEIFKRFRENSIVAICLLEECGWSRVRGKNLVIWLDRGKEIVKLSLPYFRIKTLGRYRFGHREKPFRGETNIVIFEFYFISLPLLPRFR